MADIALVFGWTPDQMGGLSVAELVEWRERARERYELDVRVRNPWVKG